MEKQTMSVGQLNEYIKMQIDRDPRLTNIAVRGEISNYKVYPSGHHYFTMKDATSAISCVMFRSSASGLKFRPENGMKVIAMGSVSVYVRNGQYQLSCTGLTPDGMGELYVAYEQLKKKLAAQGLFDEQHKKKLPQYPNTIGIITSEAGAAVHDLLRILRHRWPLTQIRLLPVRVQGQEAPGEIAAAIRYANFHNLADILIVGRGGGSIEELWAFNDETVAWAIYESKIPVISSVGHEVDITIADFVADVSAATPTHAAVAAVRDQDVLRRQLDAVEDAMALALQHKLVQAQDRLKALASRPIMQSPLAAFEQRKKAIKLLETRLFGAQNQVVSKYRHRFVAQTAKLDAMSPLKVLTRGYAVATTESGNVIRSVNEVNPGEEISVRVSDGSILANVVKGETEHE